MTITKEMIEAAADVIYATSENNKNMSEKIAKAALEAAGAVRISGWQPIETAPETGEVILLSTQISHTRVGHTIGGDIVVGFYMSEDNFYDGKWVKNETRQQFYPTHWQPLPEPPKSEE